MNSRIVFILIVMLCICLGGCSLLVSAETHTDSQIHQLSTITPANIPLVPLSTPTELPQSAETIAAEVICTFPAGQIIETSYAAHVLDEQLSMQVYLPPCYQESDDQYPLAVFFHGSPPSSADWVVLGTIEQIKAALLAESLMPAILVFPQVPESLFVWTDGGTGSYEDEFMHGLLPFMRQEYRTNTFLALAGISRGAIWAAEIGLAQQVEVDAVSLLSPAFQFNSPRSEYDPFEMVRTADQVDTPFFIIAGNRDWSLDETESFTYLLERHNVVYDFMIFEGGHQEDLWEVSIMPVLQFLGLHWAK